jgi:pantetheine-phosphate adenylyltransferase
MKKIAIYPGTFDPITFGHIDLVKRAANLFDHVIVAVADNEQKNALFSLQERVLLVKSVCADFANVKAQSFNGLLTDFAKRQGGNIILRGLRVMSDFDYEFQMASMNCTLVPGLETIFLTPADQYIHVASSLVRVIAKAKGDVSPFVPPIVEQALREKCAR